MNAHLNWHADEVLEFILTLYNPLLVELPLTRIVLFKQLSNEHQQAFITLEGENNGNIKLGAQRKTSLSLRFRAEEKLELKVSHIEITLMNTFKTRIDLD